MLDGPTVVRAIESAGFTHVVWVPDTHLGTWEDALAASARVRLVRVTREGEAVGLAAGLLLGGARPLVTVQCTGFFEAGDAVRNVVYDLGLPLKVVVGVRSWRAQKMGETTDNCPRFAEPVVRAWELPATWFDPFAANPTGCELALRELAASERSAVLLWGE